MENSSSSYYLPNDTPTYYSFQRIRVTLVSLYSISTALILLFNAFNLLVVPRVSDWSENTKLALLAITIVDLLTGLVCSSSGIIFHFIPRPEFRAMIAIVCPALTWQSMWILTLTCIDRFVAVSRPLRYHTILPRRRFLTAIIIAASVALLNSSVSFIHSKVAGVCHPYSGVCASGIRPSFVIYTVFPICGVLLTIYTNARLLWIIRKHRRQIAMQHHAVNALQNQPTSSTKGLKTILFITAAFYTSWIPSTLTSLISAGITQQVPPYTTIALRYLIICQSWWNAVIYWFINPPYRRVAMNVLRRLIGKGDGPTQVTQQTVSTIQQPS